MRVQRASSQFSTPAMDAIFCMSHQLACMARFEWALIGALEVNGIAPSDAASTLEPFLDAKFADADAILEQSRQSGNIAIPFVRALTTAVRDRNEAAAHFVHFGATSQDVLDTALVLQMREALAIIQADLIKLEAALEALVRAHRETILSGRSWLQAGPPITLGLKIAGWISPLRRHRDRIESAAARALVLQFGGAVGTLASLADKGSAVSSALSKKLELREPAMPWHTQRDNLVEVAASLGLLVGTLGKMAKDVSLLMQSEIGEIAEPAAQGRGGSSTMPHKHNPVASAVMLAAATRVPALVAALLQSMVQEHERGLGGWQAEWETLPEIFRLAAASLLHAVELAEGLEVNADRMQANLDATQGLTLSEAITTALVPSLGRLEAHQLLEGATRQAVAQKKHLREVLRTMPEIRAHLTDADLDRLFAPRNYLGSTSQFIERAMGDSDESH
jgi:3-carboxy-cis,cis-muconate cycloisomerase